MIQEKIKNGASNSYVFAKCDCDNNVKSYNLYKLKTGETKSCGHLLKKHDSSTKHNKIELFNNYGILYINDDKFYFDIENYEKIKDKWWYKDSGGYATHAYTIDGKTYFIRLHRYIMEFTKEEGYKYVDHKNRKRNNCMNDNLRKCTSQENCRNSSLSSLNTSGFIGVNWNKEKNKWDSKITINYKTIFLGRFSNKKDAIITRLKAELKYFGKDFAPQRDLFQQYKIKDD